MALEFFQADWLWGPIQFPAGSLTPGTFYLSDNPGPSDAWNLVVPEWMPRGPIYITSISGRSEDALTTGEQLICSIDHGNLAYNTGNPASAHQGALIGPGFSNFSRCGKLFSINAGPQEDAHEYFPPKLWDRTPNSLKIPKDRIWLESGFNAPHMCSFYMSFLVPVTVQPLPLLPSSAWEASAWPVVMNGESGNYGGYTFVVTITPDTLNPLLGPIDTRVTIDGGAQGLNLAHLYIGPRSAGTDANVLHPVLFNGSAGVVIDVGGQAQGTIGADIDPTNGYVIKGYVTSGNMKTASTKAGWLSYWGEGDTSAVTAGTIYTIGSVASIGVLAVEKLMSL